MAIIDITITWSLAVMYLSEAYLVSLHTAAATGAVPPLGAGGRCGTWWGAIPARATISRATGPIGAGRGLPGSARSSCGRTTLERSSAAKTANGSSNRVMTAMPFAPVLARLQARSRSVGADLRFHLHAKAKGRPVSRAAHSLGSCWARLAHSSSTDRDIAKRRAPHFIVAINIA